MHPDNLHTWTSFRDSLKSKKSESASKQTSPLFDKPGESPDEQQVTKLLNDMIAYSSYAINYNDEQLIRIKEREVFEVGRLNDVEDEAIRMLEMAEGSLVKKIDKAVR